MKKNIISQKRIKYICPCCKEIDTILFCCECLRKQKEKTIKQARAEMIKEIKKWVDNNMDYNNIDGDPIFGCIKGTNIRKFLKQLEKGGKKNE